MQNSADFLSPICRAHDGVRAGFIERIDGVAVDTDRDATIARLEPMHRLAVEQLGFRWCDLQRAEQVHGVEVATVVQPSAAAIVGADGLITNQPGVLLGIYVADCGALYLYDRRTHAIGLLHSGKKGTEGNILQRALDQMAAAYGTCPSDVICVLAPCIRPPAYDVDFASQIRQQAEAAGVGEFHDSGICTSSDLGRYYSYRMEMGATGRMLALLGKIA